MADQPKSKFGGIPVDEKPAGGSKFGGVPVGEQSPAQQPTVAPAAPQTVGHAAAEFGSQINPLPMITGLWNTVRHPVDTARNIWTAQTDQLGQVPKLVRQGRYSEALGHGLAGALPLVGPAAAAVADKMGGTDAEFDRYGNVVKPGEAPDLAGGLGAGAGLITSLAAAPALSKGVGRAMRGTARPLVKSALGLPGKAEAYGANPALAVLEDTRGVRPSTIARTGQQTLEDLDQQLDAVAQNTSIRPSLAPARKVLRDRSTAARAANSIETPAELRPMQRFLEVPRKGFAGDTITIPGKPATPTLFTPSGGTVGGTPAVPPITLIAETQPAPQFLGMKRQFNTDFINNWNPTASTRGRLGVAREAYGAMANEFRKIPEAAPINNRIQSLIPAVNRAEIVSHNAGAMERAMDRISRPTGALVPALIGRQIGGIPGLLAGLGVPDMLSVPTAKMIPARGLFAVGRAIGSQVGQRTIQAMPLLRRNQ